MISGKAYIKKSGEDYACSLLIVSFTFKIGFDATLYGNVKVGGKYRFTSMCLMK